MLGKVNWLARLAGFAWIGVLTFAVPPPRGSFALPVQIAGYGLLGLSLVALGVIESAARFARSRDRALCAVLALMAGATGFACTPGGGGIAMISFAVVAALIAGGELDGVAALGVTAGGILGIELGAVVFNGSYGTFLGLPAFVLAGLVMGRNRGAYRVQAEQAAQLLAQREQLEAQRRRADLLDERGRIAREIHDVLAHSLGALGIQIQAARAVLTDRRDVAQAGELLKAAQQLATEGLIDTRRAVRALRTDPPPLAAELAQVSDSYAQRFGVTVDFEAHGDPAPLPPDASLALLRVAQEALVNAAKHASGRPVAICLDYARGFVRLTVCNSLPDSQTHSLLRTVDSGYGIIGMRERLRLLDGTLQAERRAHHWVVTAELPQTGSDTEAW